MLRTQFHCFLFKFWKIPSAFLGIKQDDGISFPSTGVKIPQVVIALKSERSFLVNAVSYDCMMYEQAGGSLRFQTFHHSLLIIAPSSKSRICIYWAFHLPTVLRLSRLLIRLCSNTLVSTFPSLEIFWKLYNFPFVCTPLSLFL